VSTPGGNLLNSALRVISPQPVEWHQFVGRSVNAIGLQVDTFAPVVEVYGSFQPIPTSAYAELGLDFARRYADFFASLNQKVLARDVTGDEVVYLGKRFKCESDDDWFSQDGWKEVKLVMIPDAG